MNRETFTFPLSIKFLMGITLAVLIPTVVLVFLAVDSSNQINLRNLSAFVSENGLRREQAIEEGFDRVTSAVDGFLSNSITSSALSAALVARGTTAVANTAAQQVANRATERITTDLLSDPRHYMESAWLLTTEGQVIASATALNSSLPFNPQFQQEQSSDSFKAGQNLVGANQNQSSTLVVSDRNGLPNLEIVNVVKTTSNKVVGYFVVSLDLNELVFKNLKSDNESYNVYSFMVMPDGNTTLQLLDVRLKKLVYTNSIGVERALSGQAANVTSYATGILADRTVIGFYAPIKVLDTRFAFITELDQSVVIDQRLDYVTRYGFPVVVFLLASILIITLLFNNIITPPLGQLRDAMRGVINGNFDMPVPTVARNDEVGVLAVTFVDMREQVNRLITDMRQRLEERTRDVRVTQDISRAAIAERNLQILLTNIIQLITQNFPNVYHAQIFLVDADKEFAVLRASTGQAGQELLKRGHKLAIGSVSVIGQVTEQGQLVVARDISASNVHRQNEFLPETQAELAIPLMLGAKIIGALDVQSKQRDSFSDDQVTALQTLADQITIAIENARLFEESQRLVSSLEVEKQTRTRRAWQDYFNAQRTSAMVSQFGNATDYDDTALRAAVIASGQSVVGDKTERNTIPFAIPIRLRGQTLGVVKYELQEGDFNYNKVLLAEELVSRLAISLDNARLFQDSVKSAERERLVNEISAKLTSQTDIQDIIETALREVGEALNTPQVAIRFQLANNTPISPTNGNHAEDNHPNNDNGRKPLVTKPIE